MSTITASEARQTLPAQLDRVEAGDEVSITRHGRIVAVLVSPGALRARRAPEAWADAARIEEMLRRARREPLSGAPLSRERAEELIESVRVGRDE